MKRTIGVIIVILAILTVSACSEHTGNEGKDHSENKPIIAVSIVPQKTWVETIVGDFAEVAVMIPPGKSPANYAPSPKELQRFSDASVYFTIGVPTENVNVLSKAEDMNPNMKIVHLEKKAAEHYKERQFASGKRDQHIWLSPKRAQVMVQEIADVLSEQYPEEKERFQKNAATYIEEITAVDKEIKMTLTDMKPKKFIVYHPAFGYFAEDYGLEMIAIEQDGKAATPERRQEIVDIAKKEDIKVVFYQAEIDGSQSKSIADEIKGKTVQIIPLSPDYVKNLKVMAETFKESLEQ